MHDVVRTNQATNKGLGHHDMTRTKCGILKLHHFRRVFSAGRFGGRISQLQNKSKSCTVVVAFIRVRPFVSPLSRPGHNAQHAHAPAHTRTLSLSLCPPHCCSFRIIRRAWLSLCMNHTHAAKHPKCPQLYTPRPQRRFRSFTFPRHTPPITSPPPPTHARTCDCCCHDCCPPRDCSRGCCPRRGSATPRSRPRSPPSRPLAPRAQMAPRPRPAPASAASAGSPRRTGSPPARLARPP